MDKQEKDGPLGFDQPLTRLIKIGRGLKRGQMQMFVLQLVQVLLLALILWRVW